jgi:DNA-binding HxlR family transcriptional regulator
MYDYGEYCPIAKAVQVLCERWTLLILREMLSGVTRFNEFRKFLPRISPTLLRDRLRLLEDKGLLVRRKVPEQDVYEYQLTAAGRELEPIIFSLGDWAVRWVASAMSDEELNVNVLMRDIQQHLVTSHLPPGRTVIQFQLTDWDQNPRWFMRVENGRSELCDEERTLDVDVYVTSDRRTLAEALMGHMDLKQAVRAGRVKVIGPERYVRSFPAWFARSPFVIRPSGSVT